MFPGYTGSYLGTFQRSSLIFGLGSSVEHYNLNSMVSRTRDDPTLALCRPLVHLLLFLRCLYLPCARRSEVTNLYFLTKSIRRNNWFEPDLGLCIVGHFGLNVVQKLEKIGRPFSCLVLCIALLPPQWVDSEPVTLETFWGPSLSRLHSSLSFVSIATPCPLSLSHQQLSPRHLSPSAGPYFYLVLQPGSQAIVSVWGWSHSLPDRPSLP